MASRLGYLAIRNTLYKAIYDARKPAKPTNDLTHREKGVIAAFSGGLATAVVHPLETIMVRKIGDVGRAAKFQRVNLREHLYKGFGANVLKMALLNGLMIWPYDVIKEKCYVTFGDIWPNRFLALAAATWVGFGATFLLDNIRTRQMYAFSNPALNRLNYRNAADVVSKGLRNEGTLTFMVGTWPMVGKLYVYAACVSSEDPAGERLDDGAGAGTQVGGRSIMSAKKLIDFRLAHLNKTMSISYSGNPFVIAKSKGVFFTDDSGAQLLDCINNVSHIGHCHPEYVRRMSAQLDTLVTNCRFLYPQMQSATEKLLKLLPPHLTRVLYVNSGSEANDIAMQMARVCSGEPTIYCHEGAYHGLTQSCMDVSPYKWNDHYKKQFRNVVLASPCTYRGKYSHLKDSSQRYAADFAAKVTQKKRFAGFITESMLSCAGQVIPKEDYFQEIHAVVKRHNGYYISDEVQTGFGRLGTHPFAFQHYGVKPDIVTMGKAMGNGFPVSAVVCTEEVGEKFFARGIEYFATYGGNPLAVTAAEAVMDVIEAEKLQENALRVGAYLLENLKKFLKYEIVGDVRGQGLFLGIEFVVSKKSKKPNKKMAKRVQTLTREQNVLVSVDAIAENVVKIKPPIVFSMENADQLLAALGKSIEQAQSEAKSS